MRAVVTGDWHIGEYATGPTQSGLNMRIPDIVNQVIRMRDYMLHNAIRHLIVCGDIFRSKQPSMLSLGVVSEILYGFRECGVTVWIITGNHDVFRSEGQAHALTVFKSLHLSNVNIFDAPQGVSIEGVKFLFFPYMASPQDGRLQQAIAQFPGNDILVMHGTIEGGIIGKGTEYEIHDTDEIKAETVGSFKTVFAGHLHRQHTMGQVWYPGSIERLTFDDEGSDKIFLDVVIADNGQATVRPIALEARPMMTLSYDQMPQVVAGILNVKGAVVRVTDVEPDYFEEVSNILRGKGCYHVASVQRKTHDRVDIKQAESARLDVADFVRRFAEKEQYKGDIDEATKTITEELNS
jgi:exonuclease SbcD